MTTSENIKELNSKIKELEFDLSCFRNFNLDNQHLSNLHLAISTYLTDSGAREN